MIYDFSFWRDVLLFIAVEIVAVFALLALFRWRRERKKNFAIHIIVERIEQKEAREEAARQRGLLEMYREAETNQAGPRVLH